MAPGENEFSFSPLLYCFCSHHWSKQVRWPNLTSTSWGIQVLLLEEKLGIGEEWCTPQLKLKDDHCFSLLYSPLLFGKETQSRSLATSSNLRSFWEAFKYWYTCMALSCSSMTSNLTYASSHGHCANYTLLGSHYKHTLITWDVYNYALFPF